MVDAFISLFQGLLLIEFSRDGATYGRLPLATLFRALGASY